MCKRFSVLYLVLLIAIFISDRTFCLADEDAEINSQKENIFSLIEAGKFNEAKAATEKMIIEFPSSAKLPDMLYWIAGRFQTFDRFEDAKRIQEQIIKDFPESPWAKKAKMGHAMTEAMSLIVSGKFAEAKAVTDKMTSDFAGRPDLPEMLYWISGRFQQFDRFENSKQIYEQIIRDYPNSSWAKKGRMSMAMSEAMLLIMSGKYVEAKEATDKMAVDFAGRPDLPEMLYWITDRYERVGKYEDAKRNYQQIAQNFPDSPFADKARLGVSKENAISLIMSKDFVGAKAAIDKLVVDFAGRSELPETLYWITERYEQINKFDEAKGVYQQMIQKFPDSPYAEKARLGLRRVDVMAFMDSNDSNQAEAALNKMIVDFNGNSDLSWALFIIGEKCFLDGNTPDFMQRSLKIFEKLIIDYPNNNAVVNVYPDIYRYAGDCYSMQKAHSKALACYKKVFDEYPDYPFGWKALNMMVYNYDVMRFSGVMLESEAETKVLETYLQLLEKYPKCEAAKTAQKRIDLINSK